MARPRKNVNTVVEAVKNTTEAMVNKVVDVVENYPKLCVLKDKRLHTGKHMIYLKQHMIVFDNGKAYISNKETAEKLKEMGVI